MKELNVEPENLEKQLRIALDGCGAHDGVLVVFSPEGIKSATIWRDHLIRCVPGFLRRIASQIEQHPEGTEPREG